MNATVKPTRWSRHLVFLSLFLALLVLLLLLTADVSHALPAWINDDRAPSIHPGAAPLDLRQPDNVAPDAEDGMFGWETAVHGDRIAVVGAGESEGTGNVYLYERKPGMPIEWRLRKQIPIQRTQSERHDFGYIALSSDTLAVAEPSEEGGRITLYRKDEGGEDNWGAGKVIDAPQRSAYFGKMLLTESLLVVGIPNHVLPGAPGSRGAVYVYERNQDGVYNWGLSKRIANPVPSLHFGYALALDGDLLAVASPTEDHSQSENNSGLNAGAIYLFGRETGGSKNWGLIKRIELPEPDFLGAMGTRIYLKGDTLVASAHLASLTEIYGGAIYTFQRDEGGAGEWGLTQTLQSSAPIKDANFGFGMAVRGNTLFATDRWDTQIDDLEGIAIRRYTRTSSTAPWELADSWLSSAFAYNPFWLSIHDETLLAASREHSVGEASASGVVYEFRRQEGGEDGWGVVNMHSGNDCQRNCGMQQMADAALQLINVARAEHGCDALAQRDILYQIARLHNLDMVEHGYFGHVGLDGKSAADRVRGQGYYYSALGENLTSGYLAPSEVVQAWLESPSHRANLLNCDFRHTGIALWHDARSPLGYYWTHLLAVPSSDPAQDPDPLLSEPLHLRAPYNLRISANALLVPLPAGADVAAFSADHRFAVDAPITYTLVPGSGSGGNSHFRIEGNRLVTAALLDSSTHSDLHIRVRATNAPGYYAEAIFTLETVEASSWVFLPQARREQP